jgi:hypothetical protein
VLDVLILNSLLISKTKSMLISKMKSVLGSPCWMLLFGARVESWEPNLLVGLPVLLTHVVCVMFGFLST